MQTRAIGRRARMHHAATAEGQAAVLFVAAGALGLLSESMPRALRSDGLRLVNGLAVVLGLVVFALPWKRWHPRSTLVLVPAAFGLVVGGQWFDPTANATLYALWFVVTLAWVGSWHPQRTSLLVAPVAAFAYVLPFLPGSPAASADSVASVVIAIPIAIVMGEVLGAKTADMRRAQRALEASTALLQRASLTDDLTGVGNRRMANALLDSLAPGDGLILLDLDHFKAVNDTRGHAEGDAVLMQLGTYLLGSLRDADTVARYGGEEFIVVVRGADLALSAVAERLLEGWRGGGSGVTLSAGASVHVEGHGPSDTFKRVDALLYQAKSAGRDRVVTDRAEMVFTIDPA